MTPSETFPPCLRYSQCDANLPYNELLKEFELRIPSHFNFAYDVLGDLARSRPDQTALLHVDDHGDSQTFSFSEMDTRSDSAAAFFIRMGVRKGDAVMLLLRRRPEFWFAILGLHKIGAIAVPATHLLTSKDIAYRVEAADIRMVVAVDSPAVREHLTEAVALMEPRHLVKVLVHEPSESIPEGWFSFNESLDSCTGTFVKPMDQDLPGVRDPMLIFFTSGTTGHPKMVTHDFLYPLGHILTARHWQQVIPGGMHLTLADTGWAKAAWGKIYGQWLAGCGVMAYDFDRFKPRRLLEIIEKHKVTTFCAPPTVYRFLVRERLEDYDWSRLTHCTVAGEPLNPEVFEAFLKGTGLKLHEGYGQTELALVIGTFEGIQPKPGSMGKPAPLWEVRLIDDHGKDCPPNTPGQIALFLGKKTPPGFLLNPPDQQFPDTTQASPDWYLTGDIASIDEEGYFWFIGRNDDIIKSSGYRIGPFEVENALIQHPSVVECAVTGVPDPDRGQNVKATVVLAEGIEGSPELALQLQEFVKMTTAAYKVPRTIEFVMELPKTISGKIRRVEIRASS